MLTKIYDFNGEFKRIENFKVLNTFYDNDGNFSLKNSLYNKEGDFIPLKLAKDPKTLINILMIGSTIAGICFINAKLNTNFNINNLLQEPTISCLVETANETGQITTVSGIWDKLRPLISELISGADVMGALSLIYCGFLLLMGQGSKAKKVFRSSIGGYILIRLSPMLIDIIRVLSNTAI